MFLNLCSCRKFYLSLIFTAIISFSSNVTKADDLFVLEDKIFFEQLIVQVPSNFDKASDEMIEQRYVDEATRPQIILTDPKEEVLLSMSMAKNTGDRKTVIHLYRAIKNAIREQYPDHQFLKTDVIRNRTLAIIEVLIPNQDGEMLYTVMSFKYVGDQFFSLNFTVPQENAQKWRNTAMEIAENVKEI